MLFTNPHYRSQFDDILLPILSMVFLFIVILSDILSYKVVSIYGVLFTLPGFLYPLSYTVNDLLVELFSVKKTAVIVISCLCLEQAFDLSISLFSNVPNAINKTYETSFSHALGNLHIVGLGVLIASILGYATNTIVMAKLKKKLNFKSFPIRSVISTISGEFVFSVIATIILFRYGTSFSTIQITQLIVSSMSLKLFFATSLSFPIYYFLRLYCKHSSILSMRIKEIEHFSLEKGSSRFLVQLIGTRTLFSITTNELDINQFYCFSKSDRALFEADTKGEILVEIDRQKRLLPTVSY